MKAVAMIGPKFRAWDPATGAPLAGGKLYTNEAGIPSTPKVTYKDENQSAQNANPIILNSNGEADVYLDGSYGLILTDASDVTVWSKDPVSDASQLGQEWVNQTTATQYSANQFEVVGNKTAIFTANRRVKLDDATTLYGRISAAIYTGGNTRVTVSVDGGASITAGLTGVWVSTVTQESIPDLLDRTFANVAAMVAEGAIEVGDRVRTLGYYAAGDGGGNDYDIVAAGTGTADGGTYIDLTGISGQAKGLFPNGKKFVNQYGTDGTTADVTKFQAAIDSTPSTGLTVLHVQPGSYDGDMTTLTVGTRTVFLDETGGTVSYPTAAPALTRVSRTGSKGFWIQAVSDANYSPMCLYGDLLLKAGAGTGLPWAILGRVQSETTDTGKAAVGVYGQAVAKTGSLAPIWGVVAEAGDSRSDNVAYGTTYPTMPTTDDVALNGIEIDSVHTGRFSDSTKRKIGAQFVAFGGTESTNGIEIHASNNVTARTHDGLAQAGGVNTITLASTARGSDGYYTDSLVAIISGTGVGQERKVTGYVGATKVATVDTNWTTTPDATSEYVVYDIYHSGLWRRGIKIYGNALNDTYGEGLAIESHCASGVVIRGNTITEDFGVRRTNAANTAKFELHTGVSTTGAPVATINAHGGDSVDSAADLKYAGIEFVIDDNTNGARDGKIRMRPVVNSADAIGNYIEFGAGIKVGDPTGGFKGSGTINAAGDIYKNNAAYTNPDYVFEKEYTGEIVVFADNEGAKDYQGRLPLDELRAYTMETLRLPGVTDEAMGAFKRSDLVLEKLEELTLYILDLHDRIRELEAKQ